MSDNFWPLVIILVTMVVFTHHKIIYLKHFQILEFSGCQVFEIWSVQNAFCKLPFGALLNCFIMCIVFTVTFVRALMKVSSWKEIT